MKYWISLGFLQESEQLLELAKTIDEMGFYGITIADHLVMPTKFESRYRYSPTGVPFWPLETPWPDPWVAIAAMGAVTKNVQFLSNIYLIALRDPFTAARAMATAALLTNNRVMGGVAEGWLKEEYEITGIDFKQRGKRLDEMLEALPRLWTGKPVAYQGEQIRFPEVILRPVPTQPIPLLAGGASDKALERAARLCNGWTGLAYTAEQLAPVAEKIQNYRKNAGKTGAFDILIGLAEKAQPETIDRLSSLGVTGIIATPWLFAQQDMSSLKAKQTILEKYAKRLGII
jgi:probable F420-dependent oxidoreductase